ncbi:hypothetical protein NBCG_01550 [Nocardioidaceae bacterium Broad-1]|nr:hypothetical protein NBCG_01550 [Nocardioidaceae bacterium Broad-1]
MAGLSSARMGDTPCVTRYYFDSDRRQLLATWDTGVGGHAIRVADIPTDLEIEPGVGIGVALASRLTGLSEAAWRTYTHGGRFTEPGELNTEAWRLLEDRKDFDDVAKTIAEPGDPHDQPYSPVLANAQGAGHILSELASSAVTDAVLHEVEIELSAVTDAELGDLHGRAAQAVALTRCSGSPTQVQAAWDLLEDDPLRSQASMKTSLDPTSACVAAAAWLRGAAHVAADESGTHWTQIVVEADDIEALPVMSPLEVLRRLDDGASPTQAVTALIADAQRVADGLVPDLDGLKHRLAALDSLIDRAPKSRDALIEEAQLCLLDPTRPGPDLLEDLLLGIWGCFLVWNEYTWKDRDPTDFDEDDEVQLEDPSEENDEMDNLAREEFSELVREAMADIDRLSL